MLNKDIGVPHLANGSRTRQPVIATTIPRVFRRTWLCFCLVLSLSLPIGVQAAQVALQWDANTNADVAGYRVFSRTANQGYDYSAPVWEGRNPFCTLDGLVEGVSYSFVVRAYDWYDNESGDSNEVWYDPQDDEIDPLDEVITSDIETDFVEEDEAGVPDPSTDDGAVVVSVNVKTPHDHTGGTGVVVSVDVKPPHDHSGGTGGVVSVDVKPCHDCTDEGGGVVSVDVKPSHDGTHETGGGDPVEEKPSHDCTVDPEGAGETEHSDGANGALLPDTADAGDDSQASKPFPPADPVESTPEPQSETSDGISPERPETTFPAQDAQAVCTETDLVTSNFTCGTGDDGHANTRWLIFRESDDLCVLDQISSACLTRMTVPPLVLEGGTNYYWTAMHYSLTGAVSEPAGSSMFVTEQGEGDLNADGIPDIHELITETDLDHNGLADQNQRNIKCFFGAYGMQAVGVKLTTGGALDQLVAAQPVDPMTIVTPFEPQPVMPSGLVSFKIQLGDVAGSAIVTVYFSAEATDAPYWLVFDPARGYLDYSGNTSLSPDRRTATLYLEDGEPGDMDGVANGIIVTMAGYSSSAEATESSSIPENAATSSSNDSNDDWPWDLGVSSCFISSISTD